MSPARKRAVKWRRIITAFLAAFLVTTVGFGAATMVLRAKTSEIRRAAADISRNGAPSIAALSSVRTTLRHLEVTLDDYVDERALSNADVPQPAGIEADRLALRSAWNVYVGLPMFPRERSLHPRIAAGLGELDHSIDSVLTKLHSGDRVVAHGAFDMETKRLFDELDGQLEAASALNTAASGEAASAIDSIQAQMRVLSAILYVLCVVIGIFAAVVAVRLTQQYARVTEREITELELFSGRVAHDIKGPLSAVGLAVGLAERGSPDAKTKERLRRANRTLERAGELVDGLLLLAQVIRSPEADVRTPVQSVLHDLVEEFQPIARENAIELSTTDLASCSVACSAGVLENMIRNLVTNAIKYMGDSPVRRVTLRVVESKSTVRIQVEDTGPGIPHAAQSKVFDTYTRAGPTGIAGLGLGLATVKRLAEVVGGSVGLESNEGTGSLLWVELPKAVT